MSNLPFDFTVDKAARTVSVDAEFAAKLASVWDAFTKQEILDQWWGPKPWRSDTKHMNFEVGGRRVYAMRGSEGEERWSMQEFTAISPKTNFEFRSSFIDKDENIDPEFPSSNWSLNFSETAGVTTVRIRIKYQTLAVLEKMIQMGFKEGSTITFNQLEQLLTRGLGGKES